MTLIGNFTCSCASFMQSYTISSCFQLCDKHVIPIIVTHNKIHFLRIFNLKLYFLSFSIILPDDIL